MKLWNYAFFAIGLSLLFDFAGLIPTGGLLSLIGYSNVGGVLTWNFTASTFWNSVLGLSGYLILGITAGLAIGFITKSSSENYIILPFITTVLAVFLQAFIGVITYSIGAFPGWITAIIILTLGPFVPLFIVAMVEFFRGTD